MLQLHAIYSYTRRPQKSWSLKQIRPLFRTIRAAFHGLFLLQGVNIDVLLTPSTMYIPAPNWPITAVSSVPVLTQMPLGASPLLNHAIHFELCYLILALLDLRPESIRICGTRIHTAKSLLDNPPAAFDRVEVWR